MRGARRAGVCVLLVAGWTEAQPKDAFTPVTVSTVAPRTWAVHGTDGRYHVVYELLLTNAKAAPATLHQVDVLDARDESRTVGSFPGPEVVRRLRTLLPAPASDATIEPNGSRLLFVELAFDSAGAVPPRVVHHLDLLGAANPAAKTPGPLAYTVAPFEIGAQDVPRLGPPLRGDSWVATNGCCATECPHRSAVQTVNGALFDSQRYAIDWMRMDPQHRFVHGDPSRVADYASYGADVLAVADATVVEALDTLPDQPPGKLPDPATITLQTVDGNHVVLDLGNGRYAFYAHLQPRSVAVRAGDHVKRGQLLGRLGNSGNTSAPHLHFHLMNGPSALGSDGVPFVFDQLRVTGRLDRAFNASPEIEGAWDPHPAHAVIRDAFPLDLDVVEFPLRDAAAGR